MASSNDVRIRRLQDTPRKFRKLYRRAMMGTASPREAIRASCLACLGWDAGEVRRCVSIACPLHAYRPYAKSDAGPSGGCTGHLALLGDVETPLDGPEVI